MNYPFCHISKFQIGNNLGNMIVLLFCMIIFYEVTCKIDTNYNGIYLCAVSPLWSCGMMLTSCVNDHEFESLFRVLEHGKWETKISWGSRDVISQLPNITMVMSPAVQQNGDVTCCAVRVTMHLGCNHETTDKILLT